MARTSPADAAAERERRAQAAQDSSLAQLETSWNRGNAPSPVNPGGRTPGAAQPGMWTKLVSGLKPALSGASDILHGYLPGQRPKK